MKVGWAQQALEEDTSGICWTNRLSYYGIDHIHVFVGDLAPEVTDKILFDAFSSCPNVSYGCFLS